MLKKKKKKTHSAVFKKGFPGATDENLFCSLIRNLMSFYCDPQVNTSSAFKLSSHVFLGLCSVLCFKAPAHFPAILAVRHDCFSKSAPSIQTEKPQRLLNGLQRNVIRSWFPEDESWYFGGSTQYRFCFILQCFSQKVTWTSHILYSRWLKTWKHTANNSKEQTGQNLINLNLKWFILIQTNILIAAFNKKPNNL